MWPKSPEGWQLGAYALSSGSRADDHVGRGWLLQPPMWLSINHIINPSTIWLRNFGSPYGKSMRMHAIGLKVKSSGVWPKFFITKPGPRGGLWACHMAAYDWPEPKTYSLTKKPYQATCQLPIHPEGIFQGIFWGIFQEYSLEYSLFWIFKGLVKLIQRPKIAIYWTFQNPITSRYGVGFSNYSWCRNHEDVIYTIAWVRHTSEHFEFWAIT